MKWLLKHKLITTCLIIVYGALLFTLTYRLSDKTLTLKGNLTPVLATLSPEVETHFYTIYVVSMDKPTLFQYWVATWMKQIDISPMPEAYAGISALDQFKMGQIAEELSYQYATIQAFTKAQLINPALQIESTRLGYIASFVESKQSGIRLGDILVEVEGMAHDSVSHETLFTVFATQEQVNVVVLRNEERVPLTLHKITELGRYGIRFEAYFDIKTTPQLETNYQNDFVGGPSGGMIQTLDLYMKLLNIDLKDLKIAGTGTIRLDGTIGPIGGIEQKIYTAYDHDIDLFLCAADNYEEALALYETLTNPSFQLVKVGDLNEAIQSILSKLA